MKNILFAFQRHYGQAYEAGYRIRPSIRCFYFLPACM